MKITKPFLHVFYQHVSGSALAAAVLTLSPSAEATTYTWDAGDVSSTSWGAANNWNPNTVPTFNNTADLDFNVTTKPNVFLGAAARTIRALNFGADVDSALTISFNESNGSAVSRILTMDTDTVGGNATITVDSGATGNITLGSSGTGTFGTLTLADNLVINHNGTGRLLFNRNLTGTGFGITKTGSGTMETTNNNNFTGAINVNGGRLIVGANDTGGDLNNASAINLGGGALEILTDAAFNKTFTKDLSVTTASSLVYNNSTAATQTLSFTTGSFSLGADLTLQNISSGTTLNNLINNSRNLTGTGDLIVETYNNITSTANNFTLGRVQLSGDNSGWSGDLVIAKGTAQISGATASGTGAIVIGTTGDSFGAGLAINQATDLTISNNLTVRSGGLRAIKNNGATPINISLTGDVALEGTLTVDHTVDSGKSITLGGGISGTGGVTITNSGSGAGSFVQMTGTGTYTGATSVSGGRLIVGSTGSINGTSGVSIGAGEFRYNSSTTLTKAVTFSGTGGTLSGTGSITPATNITVGNSLAIGDGTTGAMSFGGALTIGGTYLYEINGGTTAADLGDVAGNLSLGGTLDLVQLGTYTVGDKFTLFAYDGTLGGIFSGLSDDSEFTAGGGLWNINYNDSSAGLNGGVSASNTYVTITAVPEPASGLLGGLGALILLRRRRA